MERIELTKASDERSALTGTFLALCALTLAFGAGEAMVTSSTAAMAA